MSLVGGAVTGEEDEGSNGRAGAVGVCGTAGGKSSRECEIGVVDSAESSVGEGGGGWYGTGIETSSRRP